MGNADYKKLILSRIKPDETTQKKALTTVEKVKNSIQQELDKDKIKAEVKVGGSFAKDTWLAGDFDCDLFVRFDKHYPDEELAQHLYRHLPFKDIVRVHGSRDYFQFPFEGISFEVVPTYLETEPASAKNSTDVSALHIEWLLEKKKENAHLNDEIRLAKQFCKAQGVYGAESYLNGFSGHVLDILVAHYGSFEAMLKAAVEWKDKEVIDPNHIYTEKGDALSILNEAKTASPIIVIDPILATRNAAAALRTEKFDKLKESAREFLKSKDISMFTIPVFDPNHLEIHEQEILYLIELEPYHASKDITGCKVLKTYQHLHKELVAHDFIIKREGWHFTYKKKSYAYFVLDDVLLSETIIQQGPPSKQKLHVKAFIDKYPNAKEEKGRYCAEIPRTYRDTAKLLHVLIRDSYVTERIRSSKLKIISAR